LASDGDGANRRLEEGVQQVRQAFEDFERMGAAALELAGGQSDRLAAAEGKLGALRSFADELRGLAGNLGEMRAIMAPVARLLKSEMPGPEVDGGSRYTMQSERDVHGRIANGRAPRASSQIERVDGPKAELRGQFVEVDRFAFKDSAKESDSPIPSAEALNDVKAETSLGDNVELF